MRTKSVNYRKRYESWLSEDPIVRRAMKKLPMDAKWALMKEWRSQRPPVPTMDIAMRLGVSRGCVMYQLKQIPPCMKALCPPGPYGHKKAIDKRRALVNKLAQITVGEGIQRRCKFPTAELIGKEIKRLEVVGLTCVVPCHAATVWRDLSALNYINRHRGYAQKSKSEYDPAIRLSACKHLLRNVEVEWLIYSDEKYFDSNWHGTQTQYCKRGEKPYPMERTQFTTTVHVWGAIGKDFRLLIEFGPEYRGLHANSQDFIKNILTKVVAKLKDPQHAGKPYVLQQDGLGIHMSYESLGFLDKNCILHLKKGEWPAWSPDLSPIENLWNEMMRRMSTYPKSAVCDAEKKRELSRHMWKAWNSITQAELNHYVASGRKRLEECVALRGEWTNH